MWIFGRLSLWRFCLLVLMFSSDFVGTGKGSLILVLALFGWSTGLIPRFRILTVLLVWAGFLRSGRSFLLRLFMLGIWSLLLLVLPTDAQNCPAWVVDSESVSFAYVNACKGCTDLAHSGMGSLPTLPPPTYTSTPTASPTSTVTETITSTSTATLDYNPTLVTMTLSPTSPPTLTPFPTLTPEPSVTPEPTFTPEPTATPSGGWACFYDFTVDKQGWDNNGTSAFSVYIVGEGWARGATNTNWMSLTSPFISSATVNTLVFHYNYSELVLTSGSLRRASYTNRGAGGEAHLLVLATSLSSTVSSNASFSLSSRYIGHALSRSSAFPADLRLIGAEIHGTGTEPSVCNSTPTPSPTATHTPELTPTTTPTPTDTPIGYIDCAYPEYHPRDETPFVSGVGGFSYVMQQCYRLLPQIDINLGTFFDIELAIQFVGLDVCFDFYVFPSLWLLGIEFPVTWFLLFPVAWFVRRFLQF